MLYEIQVINAYKVDNTNRKKTNIMNLFYRLKSNLTGEKKSIMNGFEPVVTDGKSAGIKVRNGEKALSRTNPAISLDV